jgi:hypothetical protein
MFVSGSWCTGRTFRALYIKKLEIMAKSKDNVVMEGASGKIGKMLVFRQKAGQTIIARRANKTIRPLTDEQQEVRNRFTEAAYYAKSAIEDPIMKAAYEAKTKPGQTAYNIAFADYLKAPELRKVFLEGYTGAIGDLVLFRIFDSFQIKNVQVLLKDAAGNILEAGTATQQINKMDWLFETTVVNQPIAGSSFQVTITDTPNNVVVVDVPIN